MHTRTQTGNIVTNGNITAGSPAVNLVASAMQFEGLF